MSEKIKVFLWCLLHYPEYKLKSWRTRKLKERLRIYSSEETVRYLIEQHCSIARYGDGELQMITHYLESGTVDNFEVDTFQNYDASLAKRLLEVLSTPQEGLLVCLPHQLKQPTISNLYGELFWEREWLSRKDFLERYALDRQLGDTNFTRFYMGRKDIHDYPLYIDLLRQIWSGRQVVIVEGEFSRLGVGNDLFDGASSIKRIICPSTNAYAHYDHILNTVLEHVESGTLVLLALGHTATVLSSDLHKHGYQSIDVGHIDVEYEWYRMGAKTKVAIPNKYVNEVSSGRINEVSDIDRRYAEQIVARVV